MYQIDFVKIKLKAALILEPQIIENPPFKQNDDR